MARKFPEIPSSVSKRDSRYLAPYLEVVTDELEQTFKPGQNFSIVDATEKLKCLQTLKPLTRHDVAGAIMRTLTSMGMLQRDSKAFMFPVKNKSKQIIGLKRNVKNKAKRIGLRRSPS